MSRSFPAAEARELESGRYYRIGDVQLFSDYLTYHTRDLQVLRPTLEERAANYNAIFAAHPDIEFFVCYIEKDTDINFETGNGSMLTICCFPC